MDEDLEIELQLSHKDLLDQFQRGTEERLAELGITLGAKTQCTKCGVLKPKSEFYEDKTKASGRQSSCKCCRRAAAREGKRRRASGVYVNKRCGRLTIEERDAKAAALESDRAVRLAAAAAREAESRARFERERAEFTPQRLAELQAKADAEMRKVYERSKAILARRGRSNFGHACESPF